jgi:hypothetical protein
LSVPPYVPMAVRTGEQMTTSLLAMATSSVGEGATRSSKRKLLSTPPHSLLMWLKSWL